MRDIGAIDTESVVVIGYAARLPGADNVGEVWETLINGKCAVSPVPDDRWSSIRYFDPNRSAAGKSYARHAGLLKNVYDFDAEYFHLSPREAQQMDPQQRVLLETVASAFDNAGVDPAGLDKERTGVFVGAASSDHSTTCLQDPTLVDAHYMLGNTLSIISNRISYHWDIQGPSYTVDTACSSGLFALDQARKSIAAGDIDTAIVGSVNMLLSPMPFIGFSKASMLSATGLCQAFGRNADGYVRAEGAVVFVLRSADLARKSHDRVRSYVAATGTNSDGRTPGIAMPSSNRQNELLEFVKRRFEVDPEDLAFVEAHGTGTPVGDPEEARAIGMAYGQNRSTPLPIGSAKTNFGHLEPAAGLVGLLKAQLSLENNLLPPSLHSEELNPNIPFEELGLEVVREARALPKREDPWYAAVNSFGFGGANAHAVLRQVTQPAQPKVDYPKALILTAESQSSLRQLAENWQVRAQEKKPGLAQALVNANTRIARHRYRLCLPANSPERLNENLGSWLRGEKNKFVADGVARNADADVGFVFSGNGSQWAGMGRYMLLNDGVFRDSFTATSALAVKLGSESLLDLLMSTDLGARLDRAPVAQPLLLAIQIAVVDALAAIGLGPAAVLGHSAGEVAAAYACGAINREEAVRIIVARSTTLDQLYGKGAMAALVCEEERARELIAAAKLEVDIAAENSAKSLTVSGASADLAHLLKLARKQRIAGKRLEIEYPYHSRLNDPLRPRLVEELSDFAGKRTSIPFYSGCMGRIVHGDQLDTEFWWANARNKVRFRDCIEAMARDGVSLFLEISPKSVLQSYIRDTLDGAGLGGAVLGSLEQADSEQINAKSIALNVLAQGGTLEEDALLGTAVPFASGLPDYPFERKTHRMISDEQVDLFGRRPHHPLLGSRLYPNSSVWTSELSLARQQWLGDHKVDGQVILPATAIVELFLAAAQEMSGDGAVELRNLEILRPVHIGETENVPIRVSYDSVARRLTLEMNTGGGWVWVAGTALFQTESKPPAHIELAEGNKDGALYTSLAELGLAYGRSFARADRLAVSDTSVDVWLAPPTESVTGFCLDPTSTDAALHGVLPMLRQHNASRKGVVFVPGRVGRVRWFGQGEITGARLSLRSASIAGLCVDVCYLDAMGKSVALFEELRLRPMPVGRSERPLFWDERRISIDGHSHSGHLEAVAGMAQEPDAPASDLQVLRDTIGSRLAWDIVTAQEQDASLDRRYQTALSALESMEMVAIDEAGLVTVKGDCPWPEMSTLLTLLIETEPDAVDEIQATLHGMVSDLLNKAVGIECLRAAALALLGENAETVPRVLMVGRIDRAVFLKLLNISGHLVVAAENSDEAEALRLSLDDADRCLVTTIDEALTLPGFDMVVGLGVSETLSAPVQKRITRNGTKGARLLLVDHAVDLFELMTGRYSNSDAIDQLDANLVLGGVEVERNTWTGAANVTFLTAELIAKSETADIAVTVHGSGNLAMALRSVHQDAEPGRVAIVALDAQDDLLTTTLAQSEAMRDLPADAVVVWIVQSGLQGEASLRGWRRVLANETGRDIRCISVDNDVDPTRILHLAATNRERELSVTADGSSGLRLLPALRDPLTIGGDQKATLTQSAHGRIESLSWTVSARQAPKDDEIELAVEATALNFRDVMWAQGLLPSDLLEGGFAGPTLGMECAGIVTRAGKASGFATGDRVLAFAPDAFASHVTVSGRAAVAIPEELNLGLAASIPVIFVTAEYALTDLARLRKGEWCLIHGGAGGVGLAAIQVAKRAGARIIATAGSDEKRALLRSLGIEHVCDSRSLSFCDYVEKVTEGRGVDVVLNSLAGEAMEQGIGCLAPFGRFIELGKRDFVANTAIGLRALKNNISYFAVDADQLLGHRPALVGEIMSRIVGAFTAGDYTFPPVRRFPAEMVGDAFTLMLRSGHIGKILIAPPQVNDANVSSATELGGSWLIAGGTRGFGLATAKWLSDRGAKTLWLASRSGEIAEREIVDTLVAKGVRIEARAVDLMDEDSVKGLMDEISADNDGLTGIVNGAAVFDDAMFADTNTDRLRRVIAAKLLSAQNLDTASRGFELRHFWLYSSVSARFGNPGQSAYVAANMELEAMAQRRRAEGLPGLAIAWGPIGDAGYLERSDEVKAVIERKIGRPMRAQDAFNALAQALEADGNRATITIAPVEWSRLMSDLPVVSEPLFECLDLRQDVGGADGMIDLAGLIEAEGEAKARKMLVELLQREAAQIMRIAPSEIDVDRELVELGFDSLMGMSLKLAMEERLGTATPMTSIADAMTLSKLAHSIVASAIAGKEDTVTETMAERHLTESDLPEELRQKIADAAAG
ncbi:type I polyketide synthase [Pseudoruegeria sp. HB172150]|uniref:type I polyketide synthase n=1 Tax=Pseudoruegeria sp. HB172150 TaxID=2721164 RepID=UPI0015528043|nr:type I polyketide synthase [Pseudoruegeria sp. HB172150]